MTSFDARRYPDGSRVDRRLELHWGAIVGGTLIGWGVFLFLSLLGAAVGFAALDPFAFRPLDGAAIGAGIWSIAAMVICSFLGAYMTVRIAGDRRRSEGLLHGACSWGLSMLAGGLLAMSAMTASATAAAPVAATRAERVTDRYADRTPGAPAPLTRTDRARLRDTSADLAKAAGTAAGGSLLALLAALGGALFACSRLSGMRLTDELRTAGGKRNLHQTVQAQMDRDRSERPTILPPTH